MTKISFLLNFILVVGFLKKCCGDKTGVTFTFKEYQYKDSPKNVRKINSNYEKTINLRTN